MSAAPAHRNAAGPAPAAATGLDAMAMPLHGSHLVEASAGTGKTWTIAALYVRLVLGDEGPGANLPGHEGSGARGDGAAAAAPVRPPLLPSQILVMTFTRAATRELAARIRTRLLEAAGCLRGTLAPRAEDAFLTGLLARHAAPAARAVAAWRAARAAELMDEAAVHTIDAWCQRMLREHAFDSGSLFEVELEANELARRAEASRDYWRQQVYPLQGDALQAVLGLWPEPGRLLSDIGKLLDEPGVMAGGAGELGPRLAELLTQRRGQLAQVKQRWGERAFEMRRWLDAQFERKDNPFDKSRFKQDRYRDWTDAVAAWARDPDSESLALTESARHRLTPRGLREVMKPGAAAAVVLPAAFEAWAELDGVIDGLPDVGAMLRAHAAARIRRRLAELKAMSGTFGFADIQERLNEALDAQRHGERALRLRDHIVRAFPAALIDEFQDTSPVQLSIFRRLYRIEANDPARLLVLIGDPKQAIYAFRGADIHSYLRARRATEGRHHVLGTNRRATAALVRVVNELFTGAEQRAGRGAFLFRDETALGNELPFAPVGAQGRGERFVTAAGDAPACWVCLDTPAPPVRGKVESRAVHAALAAERIVAWLNDADAGFAAEGAAQGAAQGGRAEFTRLRPADIAVLVRTGVEAAAVQRALRRRGVASVFQSDKESVFACAEARDLLRLLQAAAAPRDARLVRAALATQLVGLSLAELRALAEDDEAFDARAALVHELHARWQSQGVLAMLRRAVHGLNLPARWLAGEGAERIAGERRLTNLFHLAELAQAESARLAGEQALVRWLAEQIHEAEAGRDAAAAGASDDRVLRLESDADLVRVVTVHQSKGLQYRLVLLPFAAHLPGGDERERPAYVFVPGPQGERRLVFAPGEADREADEQERRREDVRLLYVALTRAEFGLWLGVAPVSAGRSSGNAWHRCALGHLVSGGEPRTPDALASDLRAFAARVPGEVVIDTADVGHAARGAPAGAVAAAPGAAEEGEWAVPVTPLRVREVAPPLRPALRYEGRFDRSWAISSYSALVKGLATAPGAAAAMLAASASAGSVLAPAGGAGPAQAIGAMRDLPERRLEATAGSAAGQEPSGDMAATPSPAGDWVGDEWLHIDEPEDAPSEATPLQAQAAAPWHRFPRGAWAGNFLHGQLEWLASEGFALATSPELEAALRRRCERQGWGHRADDLVAWLQVVCTTPLPALGAPAEEGGSSWHAAGPGVPLAGLSRALPEMEFWLPSDGWRVRAVDALCRAHILPGQPRPALPPRLLSGLLMGFADLVFEHQGRFGVLDYKSNALGDDDAAYTGAAMAAAMLQHRYDVQAALYLLALHRLLRQRLRATYRPAQHLHGAVYFFLRGVRGPAAGAWHLRPPLALIEALDAMVADAGVAAAGGHA